MNATPFDFDAERREDGSIDLSRIFREHRRGMAKTRGYLLAMSYLERVEHYRPIRSRQVAASVLAMADTLYSLGEEKLS